MGISEAKKSLVEALLAKIDEELTNMRRAAKDAAVAATHPEAKPENDKDTRALEASYLARGQAARVAELESAVKVLGGMKVLDLTGKPIQASALVVVEDEDEVKSTYFVAPFGGGTALPGKVQVVTPQSPLGAALLGKSEGDVIELKKREMTIVSVT